MLYLLSTAASVPVSTAEKSGVRQVRAKLMKELRDEEILRRRMSSGGQSLASSTRDPLPLSVAANALLLL